MTHDTTLQPNYREIEDQFEIPIYPKRDLSIQRGEEALVWDDEGNEYIDCAAGIGVASIGHSNPSVVEAITSQASELITCPEIFYNQRRAELLELLNEITPEYLSQFFLCNSGTESVEAALKFARFNTNKPNVVGAMRSFHGRTLGSLSASFQRKYRKPFEPLLDGFDFVPFGKIDRLHEAVDERTGILILEIIQGNGGINTATEEYFEEVQQLCNEKDIILIIDEVQTGFGRTGKMFAFQHYNLRPDIVCVAKAMGGGFPIGATLCSKDIQMKPNLHGSTFGGNPLACVAAIASINYILDHNLPNQALKKGRYFVEQLKEHDIPVIRSIRQKGLMVGIELRTRVYQYLNELMENGILALPAGSTVIRLLPPLVITYDQIDTVINRLKEVLSD